MLAQNAGISTVAIQNKEYFWNTWSWTSIAKDVLGYWRIRGMAFTNDGQEDVSQGEKLFQKYEDVILEYEKVCQTMNKRVPNLSAECFFFLRLCLSTLLHWIPTLKVEAMMTMITISKLKTLALIRAWSCATIEYGRWNMHKCAKLAG